MKPTTSFIAMAATSLAVGLAAPAPILADTTDATDKSDLSVLFVGPNPDDVRASVSNILFMYDKAETTYKTHTAHFKQLLETHFDEVGVVYGENFTPDMADDYDVVIFDAMIKPVGTRKQVFDYGNGNTQTHDINLYFAEDYSKPTILIGYVAPQLTGSVGTKLDWL